jgi:hypothetical protein
MASKKEDAPVLDMNFLKKKLTERILPSIIKPAKEKLIRD